MLLAWWPLAAAASRPRSPDLDVEALPPVSDFSRALRAGSSVQFACMVLSGLAGLSYWTLLARHLDTDLIGHGTALLSVVLAGNFLTNLGLVPTIARWTARTADDAGHYFFPRT